MYLQVAEYFTLQYLFAFLGYLSHKCNFPIVKPLERFRLRWKIFLEVTSTWTRRMLANTSLLQSSNIWLLNEPVCIPTSKRKVFSLSVRKIIGWFVYVIAHFKDFKMFWELFDLFAYNMPFKILSIAPSTTQLELCLINV